MAIFLDTAILPRAPRPLSSLSIAAVRAVASATGQEIIIAETVADEFLHHWISGAAEAVTRAAQATSVVNDFLPGYAVVPSEPDFAALEASRRADVKDLARIIPLSDSVAREAIQREARRVPPASGGSGVRDAAIWLASVAEHVRLGEVSTFVSPNTSDFADPSDPTHLHPTLAADIPVDAQPMGFTASTEGLLHQLATTAEAPDLSGIASLESMIEAAAQAVVELIESEPSPTSFASPYVASPVEVEFQRLWGEKTFEIEGQPVTVFGSLWDFATNVGFLRRHPGGGLSETAYPEARGLVLHVMLRGDPAFDAPEVEVLSVESTAHSGQPSVRPSA